jgi:hypothetical protein
MIETLNALLDEPILLLAVLAVGAAIGITIEKIISRQDRAKRRAYWRGRNHGKKPPAVVKSVPSANREPGGGDIAAEQLRMVMKAEFKRRSLLNKKEAEVFLNLDRLVIDRNPEWQVMAQVSVGEFLACDDPDAYRCINSKRVDFVLMDTDCQARHALEYQGDGHHQGSAAARDAVKKEALRKAGVGYHEIVAGHTTRADLKRLVEKLVPALSASK